MKSLDTIFYFQQNLNDSGYNANHVTVSNKMDIHYNRRSIARYHINTDKLEYLDKRHKNTIDRIYYISFNQLTLF